MTTVPPSIFTSPSGVQVTIGGTFDVSTFTYDGLGGTDTLLMSNRADYLGTGTLANIETVVAGAGADFLDLSDQPGAMTIDAGSDADTVFAGAGADLLRGLTGDDFLDGGAGDDVIYGGSNNPAQPSGNDTIIGGTGADLLRGGDGNDRLLYVADAVDGGTGKNRSHDVFDGGDGQDVIEMTAGDDVLLLDDSASPVHPLGSSVRVIGVERVDAGPGDDVIDLRAFEYLTQISVYGGDGDDLAALGREGDAFYGEGGDDTFIVSFGGDTFAGGADMDTLVFEGGIGIEQILGLRPDDLNGTNPSRFWIDYFDPPYNAISFVFVSDVEKVRIGGRTYPFADFDAAVEAANVPLPAALWLMFGGLGALGAAARPRRRGVPAPCPGPSRGVVAKS